MGFTEVSLRSVLSFSGQLPCDVYLQLGSDKFTKVFAKGQMIDLDRFQTYRKKGARSVWIKRQERLQYMTGTETLVGILLKNKKTHLPPFKHLVEDLCTQCLETIYFDKKIDPVVISILRSTVAVISKLTDENMAVFMHLLGRARDKRNQIKHLIQSALLAILLARADGNRDASILNIVGLTGLLHDIGLVHCNIELDELSPHLTPPEREALRLHPANGSRWLNFPSFPSEVRTAIEQHHEAWNGSGYPHGLHGEKIYYPARIVAIVDRFSNLTAAAGQRMALSPALALLSLEKSGAYDPRLIRRFQALLQPAKKSRAA